MEIEVEDVDTDDLTQDQRAYLAMRVFQYLADSGVPPGRVVVKGSDECDDEIVEQDGQGGSR